MFPFPRLLTDVPPTFDTQASAAIKDCRRLINLAARAKLAEAATLAIAGDAQGADQATMAYNVLRHKAISIPLDMIEMERCGAEPFELNQD